MRRLVQLLALLGGLQVALCDISALTGVAGALDTLHGHKAAAADKLAGSSASSPQFPKYPQASDYAAGTCAGYAFCFATWNPPVYTEPDVVCPPNYEITTNYGRPFCVQKTGVCSSGFDLSSKGECCTVKQTSSCFANWDSCDADSTSGTDIGSICQGTPAYKSIVDSVQMVQVTSGSHWYDGTHDTVAATSGSSTPASTTVPATGSSDSSASLPDVDYKVIPAGSTIELNGQLVQVGPGSSSSSSNASSAAAGMAGMTAEQMAALISRQQAALEALQKQAASQGTYIANQSGLAGAITVAPVPATTAPPVAAPAPAVAPAVTAPGAAMPAPAALGANSAQQAALEALQKQAAAAGTYVAPQPAAAVTQTAPAATAAAPATTPIVPPPSPMLVGTPAAALEAPSIVYTRPGTAATTTAPVAVTPAAPAAAAGAAMPAAAASPAGVEAASEEPPADDYTEADDTEAEAADAANATGNATVAGVGAAAAAAAATGRNASARLSLMEARRTRSHPRGVASTMSRSRRSAEVTPVTGSAQQQQPNKEGLLLLKVLLMLPKLSLAGLAAGTAAVGAGTAGAAGAGLGAVAGAKVASTILATKEVVMAKGTSKEDVLPKCFSKCCSSDADVVCVAARTAVNYAKPQFVCPPGCKYISSSGKCLCREGNFSPCMPTDTVCSWGDQPICAGSADFFGIDACKFVGALQKHLPKVQCPY